jgi:hypothetical protein
MPNLRQGYWPSLTSLGPLPQIAANSWYCLSKRKDGKTAKESQGQTFSGKSPSLSKIEPPVTANTNPATRVTCPSTCSTSQNASTTDVLLGSLVFGEARRTSKASLNPVAEGAQINVDLDSTSVPSHHPRAVTPGASWRGSDFSASRSAWTEESASPMAQHPATSTPGSRRKPQMPPSMGERPFASLPAAARRHGSHVVMTPPQNLTVLSPELSVTSLDPSASSRNTNPQPYSMPNRRYSSPNIVPGAQAMIVEEIERDQVGDDATSVPGSASNDHYA